MPPDAPIPASSPHPLLAGLGGDSAAAPVRFGRGLLLPFRALRFLAGQPRLWPLVLIPALINAALFAAAVVLVLSQADLAAGLLWPRPDGALVALWYVLYVLVIGLGLVLAYVFVLLIGGVIASPFHDLLSERTEALLTPGSPPAPEASWADTLRSIRSTALISLLYAVLLGPILLLNVIPGLGSLLATVLGGLVGAFFVALEYADVMLQRHGYSLRQKLRLLRRNAAFAGGFGIGTHLLLWIPLVNFFTMPVAVVAGTALAVRMTRSPPANT